MGRPPNFRYVSLKAGFFVLAGLLVSLLSLFLAGRYQGWFGVFPILTIDLPEEGSYGLKDGAEVQILGIVIGQVRDVQVPPSGRMQAVLRITKPDFMNFIRRDSRAVVKKKFGVAGDAFVEFTRGTGPKLDPEQTVLKAEADQEILRLIQDFIGRFQDEALPALQKVPVLITEYTNLAQFLNDPEGPFRLLFKRFDRIMGSLQDLTDSITAGEGVVGRLLKDPDLNEKVRTMLARLDDSLADVRSILEHLDQATARLPGIAARLQDETERLPGAMQRTQKILELVQGLLVDVQAMGADIKTLTAAAAGEAKDLPGLMLQVQELLRQTQRLIQGFQRHWLLRSYVPQENKAGRIPPAAIGLEGER